MLHMKQSSTPYVLFHTVLCLPHLCFVPHCLLPYQRQYYTPYVLFHTVLFHTICIVPTCALFQSCSTPYVLFHMTLFHFICIVQHYLVLYHIVFHINKVFYTTYIAPQHMYCSALSFSTPNIFFQTIWIVPLHIYCFTSHSVPHQIVFYTIYIVPKHHMYCSKLSCSISIYCSTPYVLFHAMYTVPHQMCCCTPSLLFHTITYTVSHHTYCSTRYVVTLHLSCPHTVHSILFSALFHTTSCL